MRELAYIQKIKSLSPIPNADAIEKAEVLGWELVVKKGDFKVGDMCVYVEIDSILPELPPFEFLRARKFRIKTVKLRGQISQGIALPLSILKEVCPDFPILSIKVGDDLTEVLGITKYDPEALLDVEVEQVKKPWLVRKFNFLKWKLLGIKPVKKGSFPSDVPKTDEVRVQKMGSELEKRAGEAVYITEKCEGTSATFIYRRNGNFLARLFGKDFVFQVCSRNRIVYNSRSGGEPTHMLMRVVETYGILNKLKKLNRNLAVQGEVIGPKIQGNIYKLPALELRIFLIFDLDKQAYLPYNEMMQVVWQLDLPFVPFVKIDNIINDVKHYVELSKGKSQINEDILREGIVIRSVLDNFSFKSINPEYLLKQE